MNESQTMVTFVSKGQSQGLVIQGWLWSLQFTARLARERNVNFSLKTSAEHYDIIIFQCYFK